MALVDQLIGGAGEEKNRQVAQQVYFGLGVPDLVAEAADALAHGDERCHQLGDAQKRVFQDQPVDGVGVARGEVDGNRPADGLPEDEDLPLV